MMLSDLVNMKRSFLDDVPTKSGRGPMQNKPTQRKRGKSSKPIVSASVKDVNMLTDPMEMLGSQALQFRRFTRAVFAAQAAILKHGDAINAHFQQSAARWRVLIRVELGDESASEIARVTDYSRQSVHRLLVSLQREDLVEMLPDTLDQRRLRPRLTSEGRKVLKGMESSFNDWSSDLVAQLQASRLNIASEFLEQAAALLQREEAHLRSSGKNSQPLSHS